MDAIIAFAELEHFIDQPVRTYSWGCTCGSDSRWPVSWTRTCS